MFPRKSNGGACGENGKNARDFDFYGMHWKVRIPYLPNENTPFADQCSSCSRCLSCDIVI